MILSRVQQAANSAGHALFGASTTLYSTYTIICTRTETWTD